MKLTKDTRELIRRKIEKVYKEKTSKNIKSIQKKLKPLSNKVAKLENQIKEINKEAKKIGKEMGADQVYLYSNRDSYICLGKEDFFDIDEEYYNIIEEIELGENSSLKDIFKRTDKL